MATLGERIRQLRLEKGLTQEEFGKLFGVTKYSISLYESNKNSPNDDIKKKIAEHFNVSIDWLMGTSDIRNREINNKLTAKDERDIAKDLEKMMNDLEHADGLMFYNEPITDEDRELLKQALEFGLRMAKIKNKEKYTPKKYRKR
jgi:transcriptional regulator with XRE-family HTH domain